MAEVERYNALDALRAFAMLSVIVHHTGAAPLPLEGGAFARDCLRWITTTTHDYQMPVFFLLSGFFGAMVVQRSGPRRFIRGRFERIGIPLLVGWLLMVPLLNALFVWGQHVADSPSPQPLDAGTLFGEKLHHLWFLWYLLMFCVVVLGVRVIAARAPALEAIARRLLRTVVASPWRLAVLVPLTALMVWPAEQWSIRVPPVITPELGPFAYFGAFFAFGWLLHGERDLLPSLRAAPVLHITVALLASIAAIGVVDSVGGEGDGLSHAAYVTLGALVTWAAIIGLHGLFQRWFAEPDARVRYVSDASYFLYLGHLPLVVAMYYGLTEAGAPLLLKLVIVPTATVAILLLVYDRFVRHTVVGRVLHGPRPRRARLVQPEHISA